MSAHPDTVAWHCSYQLLPSVLNVMVLCSIEYNMSYVYHAMSAYFDRDNVALPGLASYFRAASLEERGHATTLMDFQVHAFCSLVCSRKCMRNYVMQVSS